MKKKLSIIVLIIIIICVVLSLSNKPKTDTSTKVSVDNTEVIESTSTDNEQEVEKSRDLNHLKDNEPSFGKLDVPVYKKGEKELKHPILIYHAFQTPVPAEDKYNLFSTAERFNENIVALLQDGYTFITLEDLYKYDQGLIGLPEKNIAITMDDGWLGCYYEAFPVLKTYNIPATIFIVESLVGTEGYFDWDQAKNMYDSGLVKIHVHGRKHIEATGYTTKEDLVSDYNHTHNMIEEKFGAKIPKIMAYPAGKSNEKTIQWLKEGGFEIQVQTKYGTVNKSSTLDLTDLGRIRGEQATGAGIISLINRK